MDSDPDPTRRKFFGPGPGPEEKNFLDPDPTRPPIFGSGPNTTRDGSRLARKKWGDERRDSSRLLIFWASLVFLDESRF